MSFRKKVQFLLVKDSEIEEGDSGKSTGIQKNAKSSYFYMLRSGCDDFFHFQQVLSK